MRPAQHHVLEILRRVQLDVTTSSGQQSSGQPTHLNQQFSRLFHELDATLAFKLRRLDLLGVFKLSTAVTQPTDTEIELRVTALVLHVPPHHQGQNNLDFAATDEESEVRLTPLSFVPGCEVDGLLGTLCLHFIKETWSLREEGGISNFCHSFIAEAHSMARAHICARGGNAALKYRFNQFNLNHNSYKNHAYMLLSCHGDVALVSAKSPPPLR